MYIVKHRKSNIVLGQYKTRLEAKDLIKRIEACDKENNEYEPGAYAIEEKNESIV